jgi:hypothetical protein
MAVRFLKLLGKPLIHKYQAILYIIFTFSWGMHSSNSNPQRLKYNIPSYVHIFSGFTKVKYKPG